MASSLLRRFCRNHSLLPFSSTTANCFSSSCSSPWQWQSKDIATRNKVMTTTTTRSFSMIRPYRSRFIHRHSRALLYIMHLRDWDSSLERELSTCGAILTHNIVDQVMGCIPSPRLALQFFIWSGEQIGFPHPSSPSSTEERTSPFFFDRRIFLYRYYTLPHPHPLPLPHVLDLYHLLLP